MRDFVLEGEPLTVKFDCEGDHSPKAYSYLLGAEALAADFCKYAGY